MAQLFINYPEANQPEVLFDCAISHIPAEQNNLNVRVSFSTEIQFRRREYINFPFQTFIAPLLKILLVPTTEQAVELSTQLRNTPSLCILAACDAITERTVLQRVI